MIRIFKKILISVIFIIILVGCYANEEEVKPTTADVEQPIIANGAIPDSAGYMNSIYDVTPVRVDMSQLAKDVHSQLGRKPKILISLLHNTNDWNLLVSENAVQAAKDANVDFKLTNANGNWNLQVSHIEEAIKESMDAIVVVGGISKSLQEVIKKASDANIKVITIDIPSPYVLSNVTSDNFSGASMLAMKMALDMEGEGNIVVIHSPGWHSIEIRRRMLDQVLEDWPNINIIKEKPVDEEDAINGSYTIMESILKEFPEEGSIKGVYTVFGLNGIGAAKAIEDSGRAHEISVYTTDADRMVLKNMLKKDGAIKACIGQTTPQLGYTSTVLALKGIVGDVDEIKKQTFCPITLVTKDNADDIGEYLYGDQWE